MQLQLQHLAVIPSAPQGLPWKEMETYHDLDISYQVNGLPRLKSLQLGSVDLSSGRARDEC